MQKELVNHSKGKVGSDLSTEERATLRELDYTIASVFADERKMVPIGRIVSLLDALNQCSVYIGDVIHFCKSIPSFKQLTCDEQESVLKPLFSEILLVRFATTYCGRQDVIRLVHVSSVTLLCIGLHLLYDDDDAISLVSFDSYKALSSLLK